MSEEEYSELYGILLMLGNSYIDKLPETIKNDIVEKKGQFIPEYDINDIDKIDITDNVLEKLSEFVTNYWNI